MIAVALQKRVTTSLVSSATTLVKGLAENDTKLLWNTKDDSSDKLNDLRYLLL